MLQTQLSPILSPLADTNGSRLAKTITVQPDPKQLEKNDVVSIVRDSWKQNHDSVIVSVEVSHRHWVYNQKAYFEIKFNTPLLENESSDA